VGRGEFDIGRPYADAAALAPGLKIIRIAPKQQFVWLRSNKDDAMLLSWRIPRRFFATTAKGSLKKLHDKKAAR
jgi:hypothetical protein